MKIRLNFLSLSDAKDAIERELTSFKYIKNLKFVISRDQLEIVFKKLGTSSMVFSSTQYENYVELTKVSEDISISHRAFKTQIEQKILEAVKQLGGDYTS